LIGGFHDFKEISLLEKLSWICPTHCTKMIEAIHSKYPSQFLEGGVGQRLIFEK
jgi:7,8-dihydropterin-6-yl-methyl-4-(beta-D-ribofuranosyl)aminobenzene 5'-phosphate synthase